MKYFVVLFVLAWVCVVYGNPLPIDTPETLTSVDADLAVDAGLKEKAELTRQPRGYGRRGYGGFGGPGFGYGRPGGFGGSFSKSYAYAGSGSFGYGK
ncbi:neuropeptide-like protein 32 [Musca vetustissima]|uniref:neuropeptide-like protein 32 n=1 Tax=Musca vetustissima TaxID=27455 RepID=UPI002AB67552|nr:neuropeptide-like protein 32 [Musca vetustissima]